MNDEQKAGLYYKLAERAWSRCQTRANRNWKISLALWTMLGVAAALVLTNDVWTPNRLEVFASFGFVVLILLLYSFFWIPIVQAYCERDQMTSYFWENRILEVLKKPLPEGLDPAYEPGKTGQKKTGRQWPDPYTGAMKKPDSKPWEPSSRLHPLQWAQIIITLIAGLLLVIACWVRWFHHGSHGINATPQPKVTVEGSLEVDSISKIKLGN